MSETEKRTENHSAWIQHLYLPFDAGAEAAAPVGDSSSRTVSTSGAADVVAAAGVGAGAGGLRKGLSAMLPLGGCSEDGCKDVVLDPKSGRDP